MTPSEMDGSLLHDDDDDDDDDEGANALGSTTSIAAEKSTVPVLYI